MRYRDEKDNAFPVGSIVCPKINPAMMLVVRHYSHRIYYCSKLNDSPETKNLVYFEREITLGNR